MTATGLRGTNGRGLSVRIPRAVLRSPWPATAGGRALVLAFQTTDVERALIGEWLADAPDGCVRIELSRADDPRLEQALDRADGDPWVVPVRVAWLPRERRGMRMATLGDLLLLSNPRRPGPRLQERILRHEPDRCRLIAGEPARLSELQARFERRRRAGNESFGPFVGRQAVLALERAERALVGLQYKVPRLVAEDLLGSARWAEAIGRLAREVGRPQDEVATEAAGYLDEMVASHSRLAIDAWEQFGRWLHRAYSVEVDEAAAARLSGLSAEHPLAFLPSHRSYLDPLVLRTALYRHGFAPNHVLGGINTAFWPIGPVARRSGVVFIRRSVRGNPVYKLVLREYIGYLVRKRFNVEWYIEGGRTRTGKLRPPRYGLLNYLASAVKDTGTDVLLVPTSIVYDQLYEVGAIAAEEHGAQKTPESLSWLVGYARAQGRGFGKVRVSFGEPLSLRETLQSAGERDHAVELVAFEVMHRINRVTPVTATALVALALLGVEDRALTLEEVRVTLAPLLRYVERRALPTAGELELNTEGGVTAVLAALCRHGVAMRYDGGTEPVWSIGPERHLEVAFYRNSVLHFLLTRAIAELVLCRIDEEPSLDPVGDGWDEALRIRDVLKFEFFFARKREFEDELRAELELLAPGWEQAVGQAGAAWDVLRGAEVHVAPRVLSPFLEAYLVVAEELAACDPRTPIVEKEFLKRCLGVAHQRRLQKRLHSTESISRELFANGLSLAANRDLVDPGREELARRRVELADELRDLVGRVERIRALALSPRA
jgi:glycerol-3-phosphate O-acyltransferase